MDTEDGMLKGDTMIDRDLQLNGMITGDAVVLEGYQLILRGTVSGNLKNKGGTVEVYGSIGGQLIHEDGTTDIDSNAEIEDGTVGLE